MIDMKLKNAIKTDIVKLDKSEIYHKEEVLAENSLYRYQYQLDEKHVNQKDKLMMLYGVRIRIG